MIKRMLLIGVCGLYLIVITPLFFEWSTAVKACALLVMMQVIWLGRLFPLGYSSLILMVILAFHFMSYSHVLGYLASPIVWLLFSTYILSGAFIHSELAHRLSLRILYWSKGNGRRMLGASFILIAILALMIPSNIGRASLVTSVLDRMTKSIQKVHDVVYLPKALFIGLIYITALTGAILATGASSTIYTYGMINATGNHHFTFISWFIFMAPPVLLFIVLLWAVLQIIFPFEKLKPELVNIFIEEELHERGPFKLSEKKMVVIILGTVLLWILEPLHHFSVPLIGLLGAMMTIFPGLGIWSWDEASKSINWDMILFFAATLMLSNELVTSGFLTWVSKGLVSLVHTHQLIILLGLFLVVIFLIRIVFVNVLGVMTFIIPLSFSVATELHTISPELFALAFFLAGVPGFFLITQSPVHLISYSYGYFTEKELFKTGALASVLWLIILIITALFYWNGFLLK